MSVSTDGADEYDHEISRAQNTEEDDVENQESPQASMRSEAMSEQQQMKPLLQNTAAPMPSHHRQLTVEQTLFDMMSAMSALHDETRPHQ
jgi:hypothetical protein